MLYTYFIAALLGKQMIPDASADGKDPDLYFPFFTALQVGRYLYLNDLYTPTG